MTRVSWTPFLAGTSASTVLATDSEIFTSSEHDEDCFGPAQNLEKANEDGSIGCACEFDWRMEVCASYVNRDGHTLGVALTCENGQWKPDADRTCSN